MFKRFLTFFLTILLFSISGCGQTAKNSDTDFISSDGYTSISVMYPKATTSMTVQNIEDIDLVQNEINKITTKKLGVYVELIPTDNSYSDNLYTKILGNEKVDIMLVQNLYTFYDEGYLLKLDEMLEKYGKDIINCLDSEILNYGQIDGSQYGLGTNRDYVGGYGICMRKDLVDKYNIDLNSVKDIFDFETVLKTIKQNEPNMFGIMPKSTTDTFVSCCKTSDKLGDSLGVLPEQGQVSEVVNYFETEEYENYVRLFHKWYENGYIPEDILTISTIPQTLVRDGILFSYFAKIKPGFSAQESTSTGREMVTLPLFDPFYTTGNPNTNWCIFSGSKYPEQSMQLLNLMYSDADIMNLLCWGIEGRHYVIRDDETIDYPDGVTSETVGYSPNNNWVFPNQYIAYVWKGNPLNLAQQTINYNKNAKKSIAYGFTFNPENVQEQYQSATDIYSKYRRGIEFGVLDPDEALSLLRTEMDNAGINDIIHEKQIQLDQWLSEK